MDETTRKAWESGPYGRCLALAREDREQKRAGRLHWSAANFIDDDTPDANRVRPTEMQAVSRAFWSCDDAHAVMRNVRAGIVENTPYAHFGEMKVSERPILEAEWRDMIERGKMAVAEARRKALEAQMKQWRTMKRRAVPLFDMAGIETKEVSA